MCGIVGLNYKNQDHLQKMLNSIQHRGPDGEGQENNGPFSLGMRRLSIIDPETGWQPIYNEDKTVFILMNGEIYNYAEIWKELEKAGHKFRTKHSDTETVLHGYEQWGHEVVQRLTGMFAFAIYDRKKKELFIARDRLGIKPLYYTRKDEKLAFASEIKALLQLPWVQTEANTSILYEYLAFRVHDSKEDTFFTGIKRLMPGHYMILDEEGAVKMIRKYWTPTCNTEFASSKSDSQYAEEFFAMYKDVIKRHLISDVPVGITLSGGLDSSGVVCLTRELMNEGTDLNTKNNDLYSFSALFPGLSIDESKYIHEVEKFADTKPVYAYPDVDTFWEEMDKWIYTQEEPTISSAPYAYYSVYRAASKHVKVTLSGNGGDELLAGYVPYFRAYITSAMTAGRYFNVAKEMILGLDIYKTFIEDKVATMLPWKTRIKSSDLLDPNYISSNKAFIFNADKNLNRRLMQDVTLYSTPNLLRYEDKNSMAFSIEARVPFLDHKLVEYIFNLPIDQKIKNGWNRWVYRQALKGHIPENIRRRRSKVGFTNPELSWMRQKRDKIVEIFGSQDCRKCGLFNNDTLIRNFNRWVDNPNSFSGDPLIFWRVLNSVLWMRRFGV